MAGMNLQQLREATQPQHEATEAAMPLMTHGLTLEAYKDVLLTLLFILQSWEFWAGERAPRSLRPLLFSRRRSHLLREDLAELAHIDSRTPAPPPSPIDWDRVVGLESHPFDTESRQNADTEEGEAAFLGALYVLEGSTLGGRMIARQLEPVFGFAKGHGDAYFRGHEEATGALWRETTAAIAAVPEVHAALVIGAARRTFAAFQKVLQT